MKNLTPHELVIDCEDGFEFVKIPSDGIARIKVSRIADIPICIGNVTIPVYKTVYGEVEGLPPEGEEILIVSSIVKQALPHRNDLYSPGELIRDENGNVVACKGLSK